MKNIFKRLNAIILCVSILLMGGSCSENKDTSTETKPEIVTKNIFSDPQFNTGFKIKGTGYNKNGDLDPSERDVKKDVKFDRKASQWEIAQWYSKHRLHESEPIINDDIFLLKDESKSVELDRKTNALTLSLNAGKEFNGVQNSVGSFWPHLLLEQRVTPVKFSDCETMEASLSFQLNRSESHASDFGAVKPIYQAQFAWFLYVSNVNEKSEGLGEFLWFGFSLYDTTFIYAPQVSHQDFAGGNPGNYIYSMGAVDCIGKNRVKVGKKIDMKVDLFQAVQKALNKAHDDGFMMKTSLQDCAITGMNIGFEIFDVWELSATIFDIGVNYNEKLEKKP